MRAPRVALALSVVASIALAISAYQALEHRVSTREHQEYVAALRRLDLLHHRANEQVLRAHAGLVGSYDAIDRTLREMREIAARCQRVPAFVDDPGDLNQALAHAAERIATESLLVETFKSEHAVLRNSLRYFPVVTTGLIDTLEMEGGGMADDLLLASTLRALLRDVLELAAFGGDEAAARVHARAASLPSTHGSLAVARAHAEMIAARAPRVSRLLEEILALSLTEALGDAGMRYEAAHAAALDRAEASARLVVALLLVTLALLSAAVILSMRETAQALAKTTERLRSSLEQQHRFVSMTSHEFRTPLSVIMSSTDLLDAYAQRWDEKQRSTHLGRITRAARGMTDLLDGLLLIGRADAGHADFRPADTDVAALAREVVEAQRARAKDQKTLVLEGVEGLPALRLDPRLFRHVMDNLVSNAVKYEKPHGEVRVRLAHDGERLSLTVEDHGIGIPEADRVRLFESFHRAGNVGVVPGTGLGLAIVKRALDQHHAQIAVESELGVGSTFTVTFPVSPVSHDLETDLVLSERL